MTTRIRTALLAGAAVMLLPAIVAAQVYVNPYVRRDGTQVKGPLSKPGAKTMTRIGDRAMRILGMTVVLLVLFALPFWVCTTPARAFCEQFAPLSVQSITWKTIDECRVDCRRFSAPRFDVCLKLCGGYETILLARTQCERCARECEGEPQRGLCFQICYK